MPNKLYSTKSKIGRHSKKQEKAIFHQKNNQSVEPDPKLKVKDQQNILEVLKEKINFMKKWKIF